MKRHAAGDDHQQAFALVEEAGDVGREARRHLETLLSIKHKAQYEEADPTATEARRAIRAMRSILELAPKPERWRTPRGLSDPSPQVRPLKPSV